MLSNADSGQRAKNQHSPKISVSHLQLIYWATPTVGTRPPRLSLGSFSLWDSFSWWIDNQRTGRWEMLPNRMANQPSSLLQLFIWRKGTVDGYFGESWSRIVSHRFDTFRNRGRDSQWTSRIRSWPSDVIGSPSFLSFRRSSAVCSMTEHWFPLDSLSLSVFLFHSGGPSTNRRSVEDNNAALFRCTFRSHVNDMIYCSMYWSKLKSQLYDGSVSCQRTGALITSIYFPMLTRTRSYCQGGCWSIVWIRRIRALADLAQYCQ